MALVAIAKDSSTSVISLADPAIDWERSEPASQKHIDDSVRAGNKRPPKLAYQVEQLAEPSSWRKLIKFTDGQAPTEFIIGVIPSSELCRIEDECGFGTEDWNTREMLWRCFLAGVRDITNGPKDKIMRNVDGVQFCDPGWLASVFVGPLRDVAINIGLIIHRWQQLTERDAKN